MRSIGRKLSLRIVALIALTMLAVVVPEIISAKWFLLEGYQELERSTARQQLARIQTAIEADRSALANLATDWGAWDDTYEYMESRDRAYLESNVTLDALPTLGIDTLAYVDVDVDVDGELVYGLSVDFALAEQRPFPAVLLEQAKSAGLLQVADTVPTTALLPLLDGVAVVAAHPILTSHSEGPARGVFIVARLLDKAYVARLSTLAGLTLDAWPVAQPNAQIILTAAAADFEASDSHIQPVDESTLRGYVLVRDSDRQPMLLLGARLPRDISSAGETSVGYFIASSVTAGIVVCVLAYLFISRAVSARLIRLANNLALIGSRREFSRRVAVEGTDELAQLAAAMNDTLGKLDEAASSQRIESSYHRALFEDSTVPMLVTEPETGRILLANHAASTHVGQSVDTLLRVGRASLVSAQAGARHGVMNGMVAVEGDGGQHALRMLTARVGNFAVGGQILSLLVVDEMVARGPGSSLWVPAPIVAASARIAGSPSPPKDLPPSFV